MVVWHCLRRYSIRLLLIKWSYKFKSYYRLYLIKVKGPSKCVIWVVLNYRICFAVGEILLLIGVAMESGHLKDWSRPRPNCLIVREGLFSAAGVFALLTAFFSIGLYLTALRALRDSKLHELEILEATAASYVFQPRSIQHGDGVIARDKQIKQPASTHPPACNQPLNLV